ncbi:HET domain-containing protein [Phlyctema vagabunda]|uniref:HET domain-containing protein n=1 Tax=Phlyctema vagabunda TaxID=108571 RepID=A0ABR4P934_9HELO
MRLIHCSRGLAESTLVRLVEFKPFETPPYVILSHTWGQDEDEVSFEDFANRCAEKRKSYPIIGCARQALSDGFEYVWIDTCCINKSSSSELSEAINSMYAWYKRSEVCYAYLDDVSSEKDISLPGGEAALSRSRWFTRGWTLQELLAPAYVVFFDAQWVEIGSKGSLSREISSITNIDTRALIRRGDQNFCIATKMSWAARRVTTREEDRAYSLLGIFGVHMPTIYGEGSNAFIRLQLEILKTSNDQSIFAWDYFSQVPQQLYSMLADSPDYFIAASPFESMGQDEFAEAFEIPTPKADYAMTNAGLNIQLPLVRLSSIVGEDMFLGYLACVFGDRRWKTWIYLKLLKDTSTPTLKTRTQFRSGTFVRTNVGGHTLRYGSDSLDIRASSLSVENIFIVGRNRLQLGSSEKPPQHSYKFVVSIPDSSDFTALTHQPWYVWTVFPKAIDPRVPSDLPWYSRHLSNQAVLRVNPQEGSTYGNIIYHNSNTGESFAAVMGVYNDVPWSDIIFLPRRDTLAAKSFDNYFACRETFSKYDLEDGQYGHRQLEGLDWVKAQSEDPPRTLVMTMRESSVVEDTITYLVRVKIT